jgi:hypothetical protein
MEITGRCLCGAVTYTVTAAPLVTRVCWCRVCQYLGAGSGTVNAVFPRKAFTATGRYETYGSVADSGNRMQRHFCPQCGTHVFGGSEARPDVIVVRAGTLDDPELARPELTIWVDSAPSWACIDGELPQHGGQPPPPPLQS